MKIIHGLARAVVALMLQSSPQIDTPARQLCVCVWGGGGGGGGECMGEGRGWGYLNRRSHFVGPYNVLMGADICVCIMNSDI